MEPAAGSGTTSFDHAMDQLGRRIATALCIAGALVGLGIYARPEPQHFEAFAADGEVFRVNSKTGTIIACNAARCITILKRGQRLSEKSRNALFEARPLQNLVSPPVQAPQR